MREFVRDDLARTEQCRFLGVRFGIAWRRLKLARDAEETQVVALSREGLSEEQQAEVVAGERGIVLVERDPGR